MLPMVAPGMGNGQEKKRCQEKQRKKAKGRVGAALAARDFTYVYHALSGRENEKGTA
jgi:hypothetical protein